MIKSIKILLGVMFFLFSLTGLLDSVFSQEVASQAATEEKVESVTNATLKVNPSGEMQWVWGEVVSVDTNSNQIAVNYLDYETDTQKAIVFQVDKDTLYDGVNSLAEIKPQDNVSIDYVVKDNQNLAKQINIEKPENLAPEAQNS